MADLVVQGTLETFDYPKKGANIPPSKHGRPAGTEPAQQKGGQEEEYD